MNEELEMLDVSDSVKKKEKDIFMRIIIILLIILVVGFTIVYFFGYEVLKPYITV